jgi:hypothetical protein
VCGRLCERQCQRAAELDQWSGTARFFSSGHALDQHHAQIHRGEPRLSPKLQWRRTCFIRDPATCIVSSCTKEAPTVVKARRDTGVWVVVHSRDRQRRSTEDGNPKGMDQGKSPTLGLGLHEEFWGFSYFAQGSSNLIQIDSGLGKLKRVS